MRLKPALFALVAVGVGFLAALGVWAARGGPASLASSTEKGNPQESHLPEPPANLRQYEEMIVIAPASGLIPTDEAKFALGMGCGELDLLKVNVLVKDALKARGVSEMNGPGLVQFCERRSEGEWTLSVVASTGPSKTGLFLPIPPGCPIGDRPPQDPACIPAGGGLTDRPLQFDLIVRDSEVRQ
jgi:hypothetical protein